MKKILSYKFTALSALLILVALLLPSKAMPVMPFSFGIDKAAHLVLFFIFSFAFSLEAKKSGGSIAGIATRGLIIIAFIFGSEALQLLTSSRHFEFADMVFDATGAALALFAARFVRFDPNRGK